MDDNAKEAFKKRIFGTVWVPALLANVARMVEDGELPAVPIDSRTVGVACDLELLFELVEMTRAQGRSRRQRPLDREATRQMVLAQAQSAA